MNNYFFQIKLPRTIHVVSIFFVASFFYSGLLQADLAFGHRVQGDERNEYWDVIEGEDGTLTNSDYKETHDYRPSLIAPINGMCVSDFALTFYFQEILTPKDEDVAEYILPDLKYCRHTQFILQIAKDPEFKNIIVKRKRMGQGKRRGVFFRIPKELKGLFTENNTYYWRVRIMRQNQEEEQQYSYKELWEKRGSEVFTFTVSPRQDVYDTLTPPRVIDEKHPVFTFAHGKVDIKKVIPEVLRPYMLYYSPLGLDIHSGKSDKSNNLYYVNNGPNFIDELFFTPSYNMSLPEGQHLLALGADDKNIAFLEYILQKEQELGINRILCLTSSELAWRLTSTARDIEIEKIQSLILLAAKYGKYFAWSEATDGFILWQNIGNSQVLADCMKKHKKYMIVGHKNMVNTRGFVSVGQTMGMRYAGFADQNMLHIEPWYWSNGWSNTHSLLYPPQSDSEDLKGGHAYPASFYPLQFLVSLTQGVSAYLVSGRMIIARNERLANISAIWKNDLSQIQKRDWSQCVPLDANKNHLMPLLSFIVEHEMIPEKRELIEQTPFIIGVRSDIARTNNNFHSYGDPRIPNQVIRTYTLPEPRPWQLYYPLCDIVYGFDKTDWFTDYDYTKYFPFYEKYQFSLKNYGDPDYFNLRHYFRDMILFFSEMPCIPKKSTYGWIPHLPQQFLAKNNFPNSWSEVCLDKEIPVLYIEDFSLEDIESPFEEYMNKASELISTTSGVYSPPFSQDEKSDIGDPFIRKWGKNCKFLVMNSHENKHKFPVVEDDEIKEIRTTDQPFYVDLKSLSHFSGFKELEGVIKTRQYILGTRTYNAESEEEELFLFIDSHLADDPDLQHTTFSVKCKGKPEVVIVEPQEIPRERILSQVDWKEENKKLSLTLNHHYAEENESPNYYIVIKLKFPQES